MDGGTGGAMSSNRPVWCGLVLLLAVPAVQARDARADDLYGRARERAIEVCDVQGQRAYLARLTCANGQPSEVRRIGSVGERTPLPENDTQLQVRQRLARYVQKQALAAGEADHHFVDKYEVLCGEQRYFLFLDLYHCPAPRPQRAPRGFSLRAER